MEEGEKGKKTIKCSYAVLVVALFATVAVLTDYIIIERKSRTCYCPDCEVANNEVISEKTLDSEKNVNNVYDIFSKNIVLNRQTVFNDYSYYKTIYEKNSNINGYTVELSKSGELKVIYHLDDSSSDIRVIANNILSYYVIYYGNGGFRSLYFIYEDGTVGKASIESDFVNGNSIEVETIENLNNIVTIQQGVFSDEMGTGGYGPIFVDIDGNLYR